MGVSEENAQVGEFYKKKEGDLLVGARNLCKKILSFELGDESIVKLKSDTLTLISFHPISSHPTSLLLHISSLERRRTPFCVCFSWAGISCLLRAVLASRWGARGAMS